MERLARVTRTFGRIGRQAYPTGLILALAAYVARGRFCAPFGLEIAGVVCAWVILVTSRWGKKTWGPHDVPPVLLDCELGALLAIALEGALLRWQGTVGGPFSSLVYVLMAFVSAFLHPGAGWATALLVLVLEAWVRRWLPAAPEDPSLGFRAMLLFAFPVINGAYTRTEGQRMQARARARVDATLRALHEDARSYRLLRAGDPTATDERHDERVARASVQEIHQSVLYALDLLRGSLELHTAILLWLNDGKTHFRISEVSSASDALNDAPMNAHEGLLGAVFHQGQRVSLRDLSPSYSIPYYSGPSPIRALLALPVMEEGFLRGVLAIDRIEHRPFTEDEERLAATAARFCLRAIQNERVFVHLERTKVEQGKLYRAAQALSSAWTEREVVDEAVRSAREIASFDFAAVTSYDPEHKVHEICAAKGPGGEIDRFVGAKYPHNYGLVSMVVENLCPLPYRGEYDPSQHTVLSRDLPWPDAPSLLVLPLVMRDQVLGTLILGARRRHAFGDAVRPTLEVLASHLAVSLLNARMLHKLETMATTDGLTGLLNKRALMDAASQRLIAAQRFHRPLSVLVLDIDFFKRVNDTYGHDTGDIVIRGLSDVLRTHKRASDMVARFGGEEFVVLCEQTDERGAFLLGERIREEFKKMVFSSPKGSLSTTCSVGIATFPAAGRDWDTLFKAADDALYRAKHGGRDQCQAWGVPRDPRPAKALGRAQMHP